jgi:hypothetical protein
VLTSTGETVNQPGILTSASEFLLLARGSGLKHNACIGLPCLVLALDNSKATNRYIRVLTQPEVFSQCL